MDFLNHLPPGWLEAGVGGVERPLVLCLHPSMAGEVQYTWVSCPRSCPSSQLPLAVLMVGAQGTYLSGTLPCSALLLSCGNSVMLIWGHSGSEDSQLSQGSLWLEAL